VTLTQMLLLQLLAKDITVLLCFRNVEVSLKGECTMGLVFSCCKSEAHWLGGGELLHASLKTSTILSLDNEVYCLNTLFQ